MTAVRVRASGWGWRHASRRRPALAGVDLTIEPGERVLLLGASGAGKSTLLSALAGVLGGADEGDESGLLTVDGVHPSRLRGTAGLVLQDPQANTILPTIGDDVAFGCENLCVPPSEIWPRVRAALHAVGLDLPLDRSTARLSGGQRQRLALAGVLAMRPGLLLLDEPTANLDPDGVVEVRDAVAGTVADRAATLVVVEHRVETWLPVVDRVVVLEPGGGVLDDGPPERVLDAHGRWLAERGVWVPGIPLEAPRAPSPGEPLLCARALVAARGDHRGEPVELTLRAGESSVLEGPNGVGKTTLGHTISGLLPPAAGEVRALPALACGLHPAPSLWRSRELLTRIGTVFQQPEHQLVAATVRQELEIGPKAAGMPQQRLGPVVDGLLERLRLDHLAPAHPFTLSGGEQRRLTVGAALATAPRLLVLDEPTFGQDRLTWLEIVRLIAELVAEGRAVLSITHDAQLVTALGDQRLHLGAP